MQFWSFLSSTRSSFFLLSTADKLRCGLFDRADDIKTEDISAIYRTLPHVRKSRDVVLKFVVTKSRLQEFPSKTHLAHLFPVTQRESLCLLSAQDRVEEFWRSYSVRHVLEMLGSLTQLGLSTDLSLGKTLMVVTLQDGLSLPPKSLSSTSPRSPQRLDSCS